MAKAVVHPGRKSRKRFPLKFVPIFLGAVLLVPALQFGQGLDIQTHLLHATGTVRWSQCAFGPDGVLWVVYEEDNARGNSIWVVSYDGKAVSTPFDVSATTDVLNERPQIVVGSKGQIIVTWGVPDKKIVYLRIWDSRIGAWLTKETVSSGLGGYEPSAAVDIEGNIHLLFSDLSGGKTYTRSKIAGAWGVTTLMSSGFGEHGSIGVGVDGKIWALWREKGSTENYHNYYAYRTKASNWSTAQLLTLSGGSSAQPWLAVGPDSGAVAVWSDIPAEKVDSEIRMMRIAPGAAWEIAIPRSLQHYPRVAIDNGGVVHIVCQIGGGDFGDGLRYTNNRGGTWKTPQEIPAINNKVAGIAANALGNVAACQSSANLIDGGTDLWIYALNPIVPVPAPIAHFVYSPQSGAVPLRVDFDALVNFGPNGREVNYDWVFGDGESASGRSVTHVFNSGGTFPVRLTVMDEINRSDAIVQTVDVEKANPLPPLNVSGKVALSGFWKNPKITYRFSWGINPNNIPEQIIGYAVYLKEDNGVFKRVITVSPDELSVVLAFTDLKIKRAFAFSTLGLGQTESELVFLR